MTNNTAAPKIRVVKKQVEGIRLSFGSLLLILCCTFLIILATFTQFNVNHFVIPSGVFSGEQLDIHDFIHTYKLIPQVPVIMFIGAFLGRKFGIMSALLYILLGLFVIPVFALGGGPKYLLEYSFGYILAYIPAIFFAGSILKSGFTNRNMLHASLVGVLTIHIIGVLYMLFIACLKHDGGAFMGGWIYSQSGIKILYDFIFSFASIFIAKYAKIILWFFM